MVGGGADALIAAARAGDQDAWRELYRRHARRLEVWLRLLPSVDAASSAEDVAAQAWLTAATKVHDFRGGDDDFAGWLFGIARNHALNDYRKGVRRRTSPAEVEASAGSLLSAEPDDLARVDEHDAIRQLVSVLSRREAEVVVCVDVVGLDVRATAAALGMNPTAVRVARHRGLSRLRKFLDASRDPGPDPATP